MKLLYSNSNSISLNIPISNGITIFILAKIALSIFINKFNSNTIVNSINVYPGPPNLINIGLHNGII